MHADDLATLTDAELTTELSNSFATFARAKARFIIQLGEFDARGLSLYRGAVTTGAWLMRTCGLSKTSAFEYLRTAKKLRSYEVLTQHFLAGRISYSAVRILLRYLNGDNEAELVELALRLTCENLSAALSGRPRDEEKREEERFSLIVDEETGAVRFWGRLSAEHGSKLMAALKMGELSYLRDLTEKDADLDDPKEIEAEVDTAREEAAEASPSITRYGAPRKATMMDALLGAIAVVRSTPKSKVMAPGAEVNVLVTLDGEARIPGHLGAHTAALMNMVANSKFRYHCLDKGGNALAVGRDQRYLTPTQEKALLVAWDYQCATPGCVHSRFLEFHHIHGYARGGKTDLPNLIPLCSGCHALVTAGTTTIHVDSVDSTLLRFRFPGGESFTSQARQAPQRSSELELGPRDGYDDGPVPDGDDEFKAVWDPAALNFDDASLAL